MNIKVFDSFDTEIENIWNNCKSVSNSTLFQEYDWITNWYKNFGSFYKTKLCIAVLYKDNIVICIMPLCINHKNNIKVLEWIGVGVSDYLLPIIKENEKINKK